jgi:hypothetical protein
MPQQPQQPQQSVQIKDVILNIVKIKKQRDSLQRELSLMDAQIEQQTKFLEDSVIDEILLTAGQDPAFPPNKDKEPSK